MADLQRLRVRANVDQVDLGRVQPEQLVRVSANAFPGRRWTGRITEVTPHVVVRENRALSESLARVDPPTDGLVPGMTVDLEIVISDAADVLQVAADALVGDQREPFVYRIAGRRARRTPVKVGRSNATDVEILDGLAAEDRVVVSPRPELTDGARVTVRKTDVRAEL
jgi:RND family efflux transporter MFP subunit